MKNKLAKALVMMCMVAVMVVATCVPAFAYVDESAVEEDVVETVIEETSLSELAEQSADNTFSVAGNGTVLDDVTDTSDKEFYTIQTANNNTFFLIIDRSGTTENVYMLSMIDENDLKDFLDEEENTVATATPTPSVVLEEEPATETPAVVEQEQTATSSSQNKGSLVILLALAAAVAGGYYYLKIYKPKKDGDFSDDEDLEYLDDGVTINEDDETSAADGNVQKSGDNEE
jgi:hypothetical protein